MTNNNGVPFPLVISGLIPICLSLANLVNGCNDRYYKPLLEKASQIERIVIEDSKAYSVNNLGQTNYFQYNGNWYEPITNRVEGTEK